MTATDTMTGHQDDTVPANQDDTIEAKQGDTKRKQLWRQHNVTRARDHAADEASAAAAGVGLSALRKQAVFHFDVQRHPLLPVMLRCLGFSATGSIEEDQTLLEGLQPPASSAEKTGSSGAHHVRKFRGGDRGPSTHWIQRWLSESPEDRKAHAEFNEEYLRLLRDVVLPQLADPRGLLFQRRPTFRCHVAGGGEATGVAHRDVDNGHPSAEINYWLPLTRVGGSNSLYSESAPGRADYAPFESEYGQLTRFWGAQCMHYTLPNETERTRVSFDVSGRHSNPGASLSLCGRLADPVIASRSVSSASCRARATSRGSVRAAEQTLTGRASSTARWTPWVTSPETGEAFVVCSGSMRQKVLRVSSPANFAGARRTAVDEHGRRTRTVMSEPENLMVAEVPDNDENSLLGDKTHIRKTLVRHIVTSIMADISDGRRFEDLDILELGAGDGFLVRSYAEVYAEGGGGGLPNLVQTDTDPQHDEVSRCADTYASVWYTRGAGKLAQGPRPLTVRSWHARLDLQRLDTVLHTGGAARDI